MNSIANDKTIEQHCRNWVRDVIVGLNFCPFAGREVSRDSIHYHVDHGSSIEAQLQNLVDECLLLDKNPKVETSLLIYPRGLEDFDRFLDFIELAGALLGQQGYDGIYQIAHFHPDYQFEDASPDDPANYTNRSPYPMLHLIRETSIETALKHYAHPESIPERNIELARNKGKLQMQALLNACLKDH